jgi:hypothetical protein
MVEVALAAVVLVPLVLLTYTAYICSGSACPPAN